IYLTKPTLDILVEQGVLMDLTDRIQKSKILSDPKVIPTEDWEMVRSDDGKLYGVFNKFEGGTLPIVRADWMKKLGLKEPKTLDEFYQVLKAFKEKDPDGNGKNDTYGLSTAGLYDIQPFMSAQGVKYKYVIDSNGKRTIPYATEKAVPVYEWLNKLYEEGILDPNFATNDTTKMRELFLTDRVGMVTYWDAWVGLFNNIRKTEDPDTTFEAKGITGAKGPNGYMLRRGDPSLWAIPVNAKNPEGAMKFLEFWHTEKGNILGTLGIEGHDYVVKDGKYELTAVGKEHGMDHGAPYPNNTNFKNPHGLDEDDHYSTAYDIALLMRHAMENETFQKIQATKSYQSKQRDYRWYNKNRLLTGLYPYCTGGKTGYTNKAGRTLVTTAEKNDVRLIAVTLNAPDDWNDHIHMYESLFERLKNRMLDDKGPYDFFVDFEEELSAYMKEPVIIPVLDEEIPYLKKKVVLSRADDEEARIGKIVYQVRDEEVFQAPLYRDEGLFRFFVKQMGDVIGKMAGYP
ncbi:MAG: extracellular solute-binding protein, partial [Bacillales bacterium]